MGARLSMAVGASGAAGLGASPESLINDGLDGARAPPTLGAAAETSVDLLGIARKLFRRVDGAADIVVRNDVAGTNNHGKQPARRLVRKPIDIQDSVAMQKEKPSFQVIPN
jgi:hypothetical protein